MTPSMRASCLLVALLVAGPAAAKDGQVTLKEAARSHAQGFSVPTGYLKYCGARFVCYTGIPLQCAANTRPYQNIAEHRCFCVHDGCPQ